MNSAIVWRGISQLDGVTPIVVVLTGLLDGSRNVKTGSMVQSYILVDDGSSATEAIHRGTDSAICGDCPMRIGPGRKRACYVSMATGLSTVSRRLLGGLYPTISVDDARELVRGRDVRAGTYGDPAAVPLRVWMTMLARVSGWTGYTHQWRDARFAAYRSFLMASADSADDRRLANGQGWRTFRVRQVTDSVEPLLDGEIVCPASKEGGKRVQCDTCQLCRGTARSARDVAIVDHSVGALARLKKIDGRRHLQMVG